MTDAVNRQYAGAKHQILAHINKFHPAAIHFCCCFQPFQPASRQFSALALNFAQQLYLFDNAVRCTHWSSFSSNERSISSCLRVMLNKVERFAFDSVHRPKTSASTNSTPVVVPIATSR